MESWPRWRVCFSLLFVDPALHCIALLKAASMLIRNPLRRTILCISYPIKCSRWYQLDRIELLRPSLGDFSSIVKLTGLVHVKSVRVIAANALAIENRVKFPIRIFDRNTPAGESETYDRNMQQYAALYFLAI
jgi:hypothetical protein